MSAPSKIDSLSPRQRECLRLVLVRMGSKEIARELNISSHTVDDHLKAATRALGVTSRFEAARLLRKHEGLPPQALGGASLGIPNEPETVAYEATPDIGVTLGATEGAPAIREARAVFEPLLAPIEKPGPRLRLLTWGIERNDLSTFQRVAYVMLLTTGIALAAGITAVGLIGITALLRAIFIGTSTTIRL